MEVRDDNPIVTSIEEWRQKMEEKSAVKGPSFFHIRAQLPQAGENEHRSRRYPDHERGTKDLCERGRE
jgi:hypothetical protein